MTKRRQKQQQGKLPVVMLQEITDAAVQMSAAYDWAELADNGKVSSQILLARSISINGEALDLFCRH